MHDCASILDQTAKGTSNYVHDASLLLPLIKWNDFYTCTI